MFSLHENIFPIDYQYISLKIKITKCSSCITEQFYIWQSINIIKKDDIYKEGLIISLSVKTWNTVSIYREQLHLTYN